MVTENELALWTWIEQRAAHHLHLKLLRLNFSDEERETDLAILRDLATWLNQNTTCSWQDTLHAKNWRIHLLAVGSMLSTTDRNHQSAIESRIKAGSMVAPQLLAALGLLHGEDAIASLRMYAHNDELQMALYSETARCVLTWMNQPCGEHMRERPELIQPVPTGAKYRDYLAQTLQHYGDHPFAQEGIGMIGWVDDQRRLGKKVANTYLSFWGKRIE